MKSIKRILIGTAIFTQCLMGGAIYGDEAENSSSTHIEIGSEESDYSDKGIDPSDFANRDEIDAVESEKNENSEEISEEGKDVEFGAFYIVDDVTYKAAHYVYATTPSGGFVEIDDGSIWSISSVDRYKTRYWENNDLIVVATNDAWFPRGRFKILNYTLGESAQVDIYDGPKANLDFRYVYAIDYYNMIIWLDDGTCWDVSGCERQFDGWLSGHIMIVGVNKGWGSSYYPFMLYNVSTNDYMISDSL